MTPERLNQRRAELAQGIRTVDQQMGMLMAQRNMLAGALIELDDQARQDAVDAAAAAAAPKPEG